MLLFGGDSAWKPLISRAIDAVLKLVSQTIQMRYRKHRAQWKVSINLHVVHTSQGATKLGNHDRMLVL